MHHASNGNMGRRDVSGVHLFDREKVNIVKLLKLDENTRVFEAEIQVLNDRTGRFIRKQNATTFFLVHWNLQKINYWML